MTSHFLLTPSGLRLHYLRYPEPSDSAHEAAAPVLLLLHGLTANAHAFGGLLEAGLDAGFRVVSADLRGRGLSDAPAFRYSVEDHAEDILALISSLGVARVHVCGHSFGAFLALYLAAHHPETMGKIVLLDAGVQMNRDAGQMLMPRLSMLEMVFPDWETYLAYVKASPYLHFWDDAMTEYYSADVKEVAGGLTPRPTLAHVLQASQGLAEVPWRTLLPGIPHPALLLHAPDAYTMDEPLLWEHDALETVALLPNARYAAVPGNHQTMLYGEGAAEIVRQMQAFLA